MSELKVSDTVTMFIYDGSIKSFNHLMQYCYPDNNCMIRHTDKNFKPVEYFTGYFRIYDLFYEPGMSYIVKTEDLIKQELEWM